MNQCLLVNVAYSKIKMRASNNIYDSLEYGFSVDIQGVHQYYFLFEVDFTKSGTRYLKKNNVFVKFETFTYS